MSRVLVTGGSGFIGSHVVRRLLARDVEVVVLDVVAPVAEGIDAVVGDVRDIATVERALRGVDAVCHQAAIVGLGVDLGDVTRYVSTNDLGMAAVLEAMHRTGFRGRLVVASSMVVYGESRSRCADHGIVRPPPRSPKRLASGAFEAPCPTCGRDLTPESVDEDAPMDPRNVYAATKVHQEHLCAAFARESGLPVTVLRYHNVYGPGMPRDTPYAGVASIFRSSLEAGRPPRVFEDGRQRRDFVHVDDVARANEQALLVEPVVPGAFNIASGEPRTVGDMASEIARAFGENAPPPIVTGEFRLGDVRHVVASPRRAERELGFRALVSFEDGMRAFAKAPRATPPGPSLATEGMVRSSPVARPSR